MTSMEKRLQKELQLLTKEPPVGVKIDAESVYKNITEWIVDLEGAQESLYNGEKFQLFFKFSERYPFDSPQKRPPDNAIYVKTCSKNPKKTRWFYHDDNRVVAEKNILMAPAKNGAIKVSATLQFCKKEGSRSIFSSTDQRSAELMSW